MILQKLFELAKHVQPVGNARVVAAVVQRGRIIAIATNEKKSDPFQKKYGGENKIHWHAETKVIKRAKKLVRGTHPGYLDGCVLYVARAKKKNVRCFSINTYEWVLGTAKPCPGCWQAIHDSGITKVKWTEEG